MKKLIQPAAYSPVLYRNHHFEVIFCWKIREGLKRNVNLSRIRDYINFFWKAHLEDLFLTEEALLFNRVNDNLSMLGNIEHMHIIEKVNLINNRESLVRQDYVIFEELLSSNIYFEEHVLFPYLESSLSRNTVCSIADFIDQRHLSGFTDDYPDEFWENDPLHTEYPYPFHI